MQDFSAGLKLSSCSSGLVFYTETAMSNIALSGLSTLLQVYSLSHSLLSLQNTLCNVFMSNTIALLVVLSLIFMCLLDITIIHEVTIMT